MPSPQSLTPRVRQLLQKGIGHQQAGRLTSARGCYRKALRLDARCPQTLHLLGLIAQQAGEYRQSLQWLEQALEIGPDNPDTLNSLADSHLGLGQYQQARDCLTRMTSAQPESGAAHQRLGKVEERLEDWNAAESSYRRAIGLMPASPDALESLAGLQSKQGDHAQAAESCMRALALDPNRPTTLTQMGSALIELGRFKEAVDALKRALTLKPDSTPALVALGIWFERKGDLDSALDSYRNALGLDPKLANAELHVGLIHLLNGDLENACAFLEKVRQIEPDSAEARAFLGLVHLKQGKFPVGFQEYESRWRTNYGLRFGRTLPQPLWKGEPLQGSRILLHAEQGMGDTMQFIRYLPLVAARGAGKVVLEVQPRLHRLLAQTPGADCVISRDTSLPPVDWQCPLLSLPLALGTVLDSIPADVPYIHADAVQAETWRQRMPSDSLRVGLAWAGNPLHPHEFWRSIPMAYLAPLTHLEGTRFYSLQMGAPAKQLGEMGREVRLIDLQHEQNDFADAAAIVANLDLVISIDTSIAHLAGAMGKPVWILLSKSSDWRWMVDREDSPWYPTARLFRQSKLGSWQDVLARVGTELGKLVATSNEGRSKAGIPKIMCGGTKP